MKSHSTLAVSELTVLMTGGAVTGQVLPLK